MKVRTRKDRTDRFIYTEDKIGKVYGNWTICGVSETNSIGQNSYIVKCVCGEQRKYTYYYLKSGLTNKCSNCRADSMAIRNIARTKYSKEEAALRSVLKAYQTTAIRRNHVFELTDEQFLSMVKLGCHYCGIDSSRGNIKSGIRYNGIDRVDSSKGYLTNNVVTCCKWCNISKSSRMSTDFYEWVQRTYKFLKQKGIYD